jgi:hypothetical protein
VSRGLKVEDGQKDVAVTVLLGDFAAEDPGSVAEDVEGDGFANRRVDDLTAQIFAPSLNWMFLGLRCVFWLVLMQRV